MNLEEIDLLDPSRAREASAALWIPSRSTPEPYPRGATLVKMSGRSASEVSAIASAISSSARPWPYSSAVSSQFTPALRAVLIASTTVWRDISRQSLPPACQVPYPSTEIVGPSLPS